MGPGISDVLPLAVGVMISPIPVIAVILMLFSPRARSNGPAFLVGWLLGLAVVSAVVYVLSDTLDVGTDSDASDGASTVKLVLGVVLMLLALRRWRTRPATGEAAPMPRWMSAIDTVTPGKALGLGVALSAINPKNLLLTIAAAASVAQANLSTGDAIVVLAVFVVVASASILVPVGAYLMAGERARTMLDGWKAWLEQHNAAVMGVVLFVLGVVVFAKGLGPISA